MCKAWYKDSRLGSAGRQLYRAQGLSLQFSPITALGNTVLVSGQRREILKGGSHLSPHPSLYSLCKVIEAFLSLELPQ